MKKTAIIKLFSIITLLVLFPGIASAAVFENPLCPTPPTATNTNPSNCADTVAEVIAKVIGSLYIFAIPISSIFILWGAFQMLTSQGEMEKIRNGKKTIFYAIVGLLLMVFASGIGYVITDILGGSLRSGDTCVPNSGSTNDCSSCPSGYQADNNRTRYFCR